MKILTNHPGQMESSTWKSFAEYVPVGGDGYLPSLKNAIRMHRLKKRHDCVVLGAGRADILYLMMNTLLFGGRKKCIIIDCLWSKSDSYLRHLIKKWVLKIANVSVHKYVVWASREIEAYSACFGLPREKFLFIPYHHTVNGMDIDVQAGDYLFSGGNFSRDYSTLIETVRGLNVKLLIASTRPEIFEGMVLPENVTIRGFSHKEYLEKMAGCWINIVALAPGLLHSGGQQTFLNSMYFGKPTIVLDPDGASDYIVDGVDGLLVEPGNPEKLRCAIAHLMNNPEKATRMGQRGREKALQHSTEEHFRRIVELAREMMNP